MSAANGDEEDGGIAGVAPDAQIFAMQVYDANSNLGGLSDDIICAIEDAVKLGADVINLSLGSDNGFYETDRYIQAAVNAARDKGAFVSVQLPETPAPLPPQPGPHRDLEQLEPERYRHGRRPCHRQRCGSRSLGQQPQRPGKQSAGYCGRRPGGGDGLHQAGKRGLSD
ncbi:MAG: S8 family serine peptidase [Oscillospiraceae bacterium]